MKNKILTIFFIFTLFSLLFINNSFASVNYTYNGKEITLPDLPFDIEERPNYILVYSTHRLDYASESYVLCVPKVSADKFYHFYNNENCIGYSFTGSSSGWDYYYLKSSNQTTWRHETTSSNDIKYGTNGYIVYSTDYIYTDNTFTEIFFQKAPTMNLNPTLVEIMNKAGEQATLEVGQIILVVIMTTAGLTVLLIGLKKGLTVLMNGFRH